MKRILLVAFCVVAAAAIALVLAGPDKPTRKSYGSINFKDDAKTNAQVTAGAMDLEFTDLDGGTVKLADFRGKQNVVLVITRGFPGYVCPYCSSQTSRLIAQHKEFTSRNAVVLVVFPGPKENVQDFISASKLRAESDSEKIPPANPLPFPILLDVDFQAIDQLGLRDDLAKPATYILDKQGDLRFAYVGSNDADRPSVKAMLSQLDMIGG